MLCPICGHRHGSTTSAENFEDLHAGITFWDYDYPEVCEMCSGMPPDEDGKEDL